MAEQRRRRRQQQATNETRSDVPREVAVNGRSPAELSDYMQQQKVVVNVLKKYFKIKREKEEAENKKAELLKRRRIERNLSNLQKNCDTFRQKSVISPRQQTIYKENYQPSSSKQLDVNGIRSV